jgi:hypothetical protein
VELGGEVCSGLIPCGNSLLASFWSLHRSPTQRNYSSTYPTNPSSADHGVPPGLGCGMSYADDRSQRGNNYWLFPGSLDKSGHQNPQKITPQRGQQQYGPQNGSEQVQSLPPSPSFAHPHLPPPSLAKLTLLLCQQNNFS